MQKPRNYILCVLTIFFNFFSTLQSQDVCRADTSFTDIIFLIDNSQSIDANEYTEFERIIRRSINKVQNKCAQSQVAVVHYGGARGAETFVEFDLSSSNVINNIDRQFCAQRDPVTGNCIGGGGDDLNHAIGDIIDFIDDRTLSRNPINKLVLVIFTDAFGFDEACGFVNCSVIRPFTNIDRMKRDLGASVTVVGASSQAEASLLAIYASQGGNFDNVTLFEQDCGATFDGCQVPRKYIPVEFNSDSESIADSVLSCVTCTVDIIGGVIADAGNDQKVCGDQNESANLSAQLINGTAPYTYNWNQGLGSGQNKTVTPTVTTSYSITITDANGCTDQDQVTVTVEMCIPPCANKPLLSIPSNYTACKGSSTSTTLTGMATAASGGANCPTPVVMFTDQIVNSNACNTIINRTWLAKYTDTNNSMLEATGVQVITLTDNEDPVITDFPADITVPSNSDCNAIVTWSSIRAIDNCGNPTITSTHQSGDTFDIGITVVDFIVRDGCGRSVLRRLNITVTENCCRQNPSITCLADYIGCPGQSIDPSITGMAIGISGEETCPNPIVSFTDQVVSESGCETVINRTWVASYTTVGDERTAQCVQQIRLVDTEDPEFITFPDDITIPSNSSCVASVVWTMPTASDNCGDVTIISSRPNGSDFDIGVSFVDFVATDACGLSKTRRLTVTVTDNCCRQSPIIDCPEDYMGCPGQDISPSITGMAVGMPSGETCPNPTVTFSDQTVSESNCQRVINRTWTASYSEAGEDYSVSCIQVIRLVDLETPIFISFPADISIESASDCMAGVIWTAPVASDNCGEVSISSSRPNGSSFDIGTSFVDFVATDACGRTATRRLTITVIDKCCQEPPILICAPDFNGCLTSSLSPEVTGQAIGMPGGEDCPTPTLTFEDEVQIDTLCQMLIFRTWTARYETGGQTFSETCVQEIRLSDKTPPVFVSFPDDIIIDSDETCTAGVSWAPIAEDGCGDVSLTSSLANGSRFDIGEHLVTISATDACGNTTERVLRITILDNCCQEPPIISCPSDFEGCPTVSANPSITGKATAIPGGEDCPNPLVTFKDIIINADPCRRMIERTWTARYPGLSDEALVSSCIQMISLQDTTAPTFVECLPDIILDPNNPILDYDDPIVSDVCNYNLAYSLARGIMLSEGEHEVIITATDACGNVSICSFIVTVPPRVRITCPDDVYLTCVDSLDLNSLPNPSVSTTCGNCGEDIEGFKFLGQIGGTSYYISKKVNNWPQAKAAAEAAGGQLAIIHNAAENEYLTSLIEENSVFIGLQDFDKEGDFRWVDGSQFNYANWYLDQPNNYGNAQDYVELMNNGYWNDQSNNKSLKYIMEIACVDVQRSIVSQTFDGKDDIYTIKYVVSDKCDTQDSCQFEVRISNEAYITCPEDIETYSAYGFTRVNWQEPLFTTCCTTCSPKQHPQYLYMGRLGNSFYYCSYARSTWSNAKYKAHEIGGNLVTIDSEEENDFLAKGLIDRRAFIGLSDGDMEDKMVWADGSNSSFRSWEGGVPYNTASLDFAEMGLNGKWTLSDKNTMREFIVEVKACDYVTQIGGPKSGSLFREGTTTITYRAQDGCGNTDTCAFEVTVIKGVADVKESEFKNKNTDIQISLFPNPVRDMLFLQSSAELREISDIRIINHIGQLVQTTTVKRLIEGLDVSSYSQGLHFVQIIKNDGTTIIEKFVVD